MVLRQFRSCEGRVPAANDSCWQLPWLQATLSGREGWLYRRDYTHAWQTEPPTPSISHLTKSISDLSKRWNFGRVTVYSKPFNTRTALY